MSAQIFLIEDATFEARDGSIIEGKYFYLLPNGGQSPERVFMSSDRLAEQPELAVDDRVYVFRDSYNRVASIRRVAK